jgi:hypothetical protein
MHLIELAASSNNYLAASDFIVQLADLSFSIIYLMCYFLCSSPVFCLSSSFGIKSEFVSLQLGTVTCLLYSLSNP